MTTADLTRTPCRPALAIAASSGGIVASTTAHGDATIMNVIARSREAWNASPASSGTANSATVAATMPAEYRCSTFSMNSWVRALVADASATIATIRAITKSAAARLTRTVSAPVPFSVPANTSSPGSLKAGSGSPVIVAWSASLAPSRTCPSAAIRSPGRTTITSPAARSAASTVSSAPSAVSRTARSGARSSSPRTARSVWWVATASSAPEVAKITISSPPSSTCPTAAAPIAAATISRSTSRVLSRSARSPARAGSHPPAA